MEMYSDNFDLKVIQVIELEKLLKLSTLEKEIGYCYLNGKALNFTSITKHAREKQKGSGIIKKLKN